MLLLQEPIPALLHCCTAALHVRVKSVNVRLPCLPAVPTCRVLKLWLPLLATVLAVKAGESISGPSLNPGALCWSLA